MPSSPTITSNQKESGGGQGKLSLSIGLDVSEKSTKDLHGREVRCRNELVDVGPTSPVSSRYFCVDYLIEQGKWICERLSSNRTDDADVDADANTRSLNVAGSEIYPLAAPSGFCVN